ncbi:MAG: hypothetical protein U9Q62_03050 [Campylobacterota bacterium]|nr:hypothetical protein [Campylobacterota bacterium]
MSLKTRLQNRRIVVGLLALLLFQGCSNFRFNATMCDQIASDPTQTVPKECYNYSEEEAAKASLPPKEPECIECSKPDKLQYRK